MERPFLDFDILPAAYRIFKSLLHHFTCPKQIHSSGHNMLNSKQVKNQCQHISIFALLKKNQTTTQVSNFRKEILNNMHPVDSTEVNIIFHIKTTSDSLLHRLWSPFTFCVHSTWEPASTGCDHEQGDPFHSAGQHGGKCGTQN